MKRSDACGSICASVRGGWEQSSEDPRPHLPSRNWHFHCSTGGARARSRGSIDSGLRDNSTLNACFAACSWTQRPVEPRQVSLDAPKAKYVFDAGAVQRALADGRSCVSRVSLQGAGV